MIIEQAIEELKSDRELYEGDIVYAGDGTPDGDLMLALDMGIAALKKQIPKKPDFEGDGYDDKGNIIYDTWICPCCEERYEVYYDNYKHCPNCGQALDWSDTDEMPNNKSQE